jgi:hypothetical protein
VTGDCHARFRGSPGVQFPRATRLRDLTGAGFRLLDLVEPEWPDSNENIWGGWSKLRGTLIPGTAVFVTSLPG